MTDRDDRDESRRQIARREQRKAGDRSARLANALMKLSAPALSKMGLDEQLREAVDRARAVTALGARRRAERTLAGDLRRVDLVAVEAKLAKVQATGSAEPQQFQLVERWRTRMLEDGLAGAAGFPGGVDAPLPQLIERAQRERATGEPPGAARALFRHIAAALKAPPVKAAAGGEPQAVADDGATDEDASDDTNADDDADDDAEK
ncbi:MAG TPA: ribosome biogenesis factor YjgA [Kofleriaceae bacterium]